MPWSPKRARGRARRGSMHGRATSAPSTRRRPVMGGACEHSKSWNRVWNDPSRRQARWCQPVLDDGGIDLQTFQIAVTAEDPGAALEAQDQAGVVTDRILGVGVVDQQQRALGLCRAVQQVWQLGIEPRRSRAWQVDGAGRGAALAKRVWSTVIACCSRSGIRARPKGEMTRTA